MSKKNDAKKPAVEETKPTEAAKATGYFVSDGKAITSKRGILSSGDKIAAEDIAGGKDALDEFVKSGHVEKK